MFGRRYVVYERPSAGEVFGSVMVFLVIFALILGVAAWLSWWILVVFVGIGAVIGFGYALVVYIRAIKSSISTMSGYSPNANGAVLKVLEWLAVFSLTTAQTAFADNVSVASGALTRSRGYGIISFRKWMWLIAALAVIVFGVALIAALILFELGLLAAVVIVLLGLLFVVCLLYLAAAVLYALAYEGQITFTVVKKHINFSRLTSNFNSYVTFGDCMRAASNFFDLSLRWAIMDQWSDSLTLSKDNFTDALSMPLLSLMKWLKLVSPAPLMMWSCVYIALMCIVLTLVFIVLWIGLLLWTCMYTVIHLFHK